MTIALGILASDGIAIAADTQETDGYFKGFALKIHSAMTFTTLEGTAKSAVAVTGSGSAFESHLRERVEEFHAKHVTPLPGHLAREVNLIVGAQIENQRALWSTDVSTVKPSLGFEAVGSGRSYARMAIERRIGSMNAESAALLAILGVGLAKEHDEYCGKQTTVTFLKNNLAYTVLPYNIEKAERLFQRYAGIEHSAFFYALGQQSSDAPERPRKLNRWLRKLREEFSQLAAELLEDTP
jgi:ATP-dependent protease HslVU (ClpYQ) peptidase subunit